MEDIENKRDHQGDDNENRPLMGLGGGVGGGGGGWCLCHKGSKPGKIMGKSPINWVIKKSRGGGSSIDQDAIEGGSPVTGTPQAMEKQKRRKTDDSGPRPRRQVL